MRIENHLLVADPADGIEITFTDGRDGGFIIPEIVVIHYAVTDSLDATVRAQRARGYWAHLSIDGFNQAGRSSMRIVQQVPFNRRASHAGDSSYNRRPKVNGFSVGIEIANPGPLILQPDGSLRTDYKKPWPVTDAEEHPVQKGWPKNWTHWARYAPEELGILATVCLALKAQYGIKDIVGHSDIAPGRKWDPGMAFPMQWLKQIVFPSNGAVPGSAQ